jgi:hypothetical protein
VCLDVGLLQDDRQSDELLRQLPDLFDVPLHVAEREWVHGLSQPAEGVTGEVGVVRALLGRQLGKAKTSSTAIGMRASGLAGPCGLNRS